jgi:hypothetical protein
MRPPFAEHLRNTYYAYNIARTPGLSITSWPSHPTIIADQEIDKFDMVKFNQSAHPNNQSKVVIIPQKAKMFIVPVKYRKAQGGRRARYRRWCSASEFPFAARS